MLTVDAPVLGRRERDIANGFSLPPHLTIACVGDAVSADVGTSGLAAYFASSSTRRWTGATSSGSPRRRACRSLVKGVHRADDADQRSPPAPAASSSPTTAAASSTRSRRRSRCCRRSREAVGDRAAVLVDGGIRRGTDIVKALALGADAVLVGRPVLWGLPRRARKARG